MTPVFLTHFFTVVTGSTYAALKASPDLALLASCEERRVVAGDRHWTGFYVRGMRTYMEFFDAAAAPDEMKPGDAGLALTVEVEGGAGEVAARWRSITLEAVTVAPVERTLDVGRVPWFRSLSIARAEPPALETWLMEIDPGYLAAAHPGSPIAEPLSRRQYLARDYAPDRPLRDVTGLSVALGAAEMARLATELEAIDWLVRRELRGFTAVGPDFELSAFEASGRTGIQEVRFALAPPVAHRRAAIADATLLLDGEVARLVLWPRD